MKAKITVKPIFYCQTCGEKSNFEDLTTDMDFKLKCVNCGGITFAIGLVKDYEKIGIVK